MTESGPGLLGFRIAATSTAGLDWPRLDTIWAAAGTPNAIFELKTPDLQTMTQGKVAMVK